MKWNSTEPRDRETRTVEHFAILPTRVEEKWVWLEWYFEREYYSRWCGRWFLMNRWQEDD